jgi:hypothetical protein
MSTDDVDAPRKLRHTSRSSLRIPYLTRPCRRCSTASPRPTRGREAQPAQFINDRFLPELDDAGVFLLYGSQ